MVRSPKSIAEAVEVVLGNAPYKIALCYAVPLASHYINLWSHTATGNFENSPIFQL